MEVQGFRRTVRMSGSPGVAAQWGRVGEGRAVLGAMKIHATVGRLL